MKTVIYSYLILLVFLLGGEASAQSEKKDIIKVSYISNSLSPHILSLLKEQIPSSNEYQDAVNRILKYKFFYSLYINTKTHESVYKIDSIHVEKKVMPIGNIEFVYTDNSGIMTGKETIMNSTQLFSGDIKAMEWIITDQTKEINGYICKNATIKNHTDISVWFTPEIPINRGPGYFQGLLGLVLEGSDFFGNVTISAFEYLDDNNFFSELVAKYSEESKGKAITIKEVLASKANIFNTIRNKSK